MDAALDGITNKMKIRAASTNGGAQIGTYSEITFEILWINMCWSVKPTVQGRYSDLYTTVYGITVGSNAPSIVNSPNLNCGTYTWTMLWNNQDKESKFLTFDTSNGNLSVTSTRVQDEGTYFFKVKIAMVNFPVSTVETTFKVVIGHCIPAKIIPPSEPITEIIHVIGTFQSQRDFLNFT